MPPQETVPSTPAVDPVPPTAHPSRIDRYRIVRVLGQGGMGLVYEAEQLEPLRRIVALKVIRRGMDTREVLARFESERQALAVMDHPNIAKVLDAGTTEDGLPYFVMELVAGVPITDYCDMQNLDICRRLELFIGVCRGVQHAHQKGVIHRDLKPSNILVRITDGKPIPTIIDFGISKAVEHRLTDRVFTTELGAMVGTPAYMSPEQAGASGLDIDTRVDIYSLGMVLYELVTGVLPFDFRGLLPAPFIAQYILGHADLPTPSHRVVSLPPDAITPLAQRRQTTPVGLRRELRGDLDWIVLKAIDRDRNRRYETANAFSQDLERYLHNEPISARPHSAAYRVRKFTQRHRSGVLAGTLAVLILLAATAFSLAQMREAQEQRDAAVRERQRADAQVEFQDVLLTSIGDRPMTMREIVDEARHVLEGQLSGDRRTRTALFLQLAGSYRELGDTRVREQLLLRAESLAVIGNDLSSQAEAHCELGDLRRKQGRRPEAWRELAWGDSLAKAAGDAAVEAVCQDDRSVLASETNRGEEALRAASRAVAIKDSLGETRDGEYLVMLTDLGSALDVVGRSREGSVLYRRVMAAMDSSGRGGTLDQGITAHNLAMVLLSLGERVEAESLFYKTTQVFARTNRAGGIPFLVATHYAEIALAQAHPDSALKYSRLAAAQGVTDSNAYQELRGLFTVVRAYLRLGRLAEAERAKTRVDNLRLPPGIINDEGEILDRHVLAGYMAWTRGNPSLAKEQFMAGLRANGYYAGKQRTLLEPAVFGLARCHLALSEPTQALTLAREARVHATVDSLAEFRSARVGEARLIEAHALLAGGDSAQARASAGRAILALTTGAGVQHPLTREAQALTVALSR